MALPHNRGLAPAAICGHRFAIEFLPDCVIRSCHRVATRPCLRAPRPMRCMHPCAEPTRFTCHRPAMPAPVTRWPGQPACFVALGPRTTSRRAPRPQNQQRRTSIQHPVTTNLELTNAARRHSARRNHSVGAGEFALPSTLSGLPAADGGSDSSCFGSATPCAAPSGVPADDDCRSCSACIAAPIRFSSAMEAARRASSACCRFAAASHPMHNSTNRMQI